MEYKRSLKIAGGSFPAGQILGIALDIAERLAGMRDFTSEMAYMAVSSYGTHLHLHLTADVDSAEIADRAVSAWARSAIYLAGYSSAGWDRYEHPRLTAGAATP